MTADTSGHGSSTIGRFFFATTVLLSAFLLFQVQPLLGKYILPWFGGSPAVWTTAMLFFQVTLFAGYAYAHGVVRFLPTTAQAGLHVGLLATACLLLPIVPDESWKGRDAENPTGVIFALLAFTVGLPYLALSATGPLLQAWYHAWKADGSPYRLYALSNAGSLAGLLTYPLLVEPSWRLRTQANLWSLGFGVFAGCCAVTAFVVAQSRRQARQQENVVGPLPTVTWLNRASWLGLSMLGSVLLLATTNHVCQDVAVFPFLWVIPLALYLLTFIICFDRPQWYARKWVAALAVMWLLATESSHVIEQTFQTRLGIVPLVILSFGTLCLGCMVCHGELVRRAPPPARLTEFYLFMSAGGALGGLFVSLVAPAVFDAFWEWPLGIATCVLVALLAVWDEFKPAGTETSGQWMGRSAIAMITGGLVLIQIAQSSLNRRPAIFAERNFYGVVTVSDEPPSAGDDAVRMMINGGIQHGRQYLDENRRRAPLAYYGANTGVGQVLNARKQRPGLKVGVVGLGVGTLATFAEPGHVYRFYEINPIVDVAAREYFTYLGDCLGQEETIIGDARLVLEREEPQHFDVLVLDAFSGDAVPAHLLTKEAFDIYLRHLNPDGVIVVHITNTYLTLDPVVLALADHSGLTGVRVETTQDAKARQERTCYMVLSRDRSQLADIQGEPFPSSPRTDAQHLWSDDFSDLLSVLKRG
ncbi:spermidine synthase [Caulifigura coniformis]|uniref:Spermidine synthase n=1 Tax=Caulifigura coniformis TaxID=2527983 RepID=A0A517SB17_9PLAN|nr:fused MFS/spermidine synthase [Caulifigura coniformis]QDT53331.1 spermidine synthase [Caulifigura coniformis]